MVEFETKYFGKVIVDISEGHGNTDFKYNNQEINIFFSDYQLYEDKLEKCLEIIDKYVEIDKIAKKAIIESFPKNETIKYYFECHFDIFEEEQVLMEIFGVKNFQEMDIKKIVEQLKYPNLLFSLENNAINVSVDYMVSKKYSDEILCVKIDEKLRIINFSHES
ncbi:MAG: DUF2004 domain-containing protein [Methanobrevibacter sp.]|nr:DUF2004 domain-containing protein [Methanobrevibacter sp.]